MQAQIRFQGAAQEVTGSMHILEANGSKIAMDCGLFQGKRTESTIKNQTMSYPPSELDAVILTHAHVDHCGRLPLLVKQGFEGAIYATPATCDLAEILLADSAHIQREDAEYWNKKRVKRGDAPIEPLYDNTDVDRTVRLFKPKLLGHTFNPVNGIQATLHEAGHMLGSSGVKLVVDDDQETTLVYTGDLGRPGMQILRDPAPLPPCDYLLCESTYGARESDRPESMRKEFAEVINRTIRTRGKLVIPSFAVGRTQVIVYEYHMCLLEGLIEEPIPIYVDSPLAVRATEVFRDHPEVFDQEAFAFNKLTGGMLDCPSCTYTQNVEESKALHGKPGPMIIVSASGMCEVGRILHHLKNNITSPKNTILIVGYQAEHTLGRRIADGVKKVKIFGEMYDVQANVEVLTGFSAHATASELLERTMPLKDRLKQVFLIHGEASQSKTLAAKMRDVGFRSIVIPERDQVYPLDC
jgi:metallo-beta-lactamase family protein